MDLRTLFTSMAVAALLAACGGGSSGGGTASTNNNQSTYTFVRPKLGEHLVYSEKLVDNLNNTVNRTIVNDVTAVNADGSFTVHEEDPSHNRVVSGTVDQSAYPTDIHYNPSGQQVSWEVAEPSGVTMHCAITQGNVGAPSPLSIGQGWNSTYTETCGSGAGTAVTHSGSLVGLETITVAAGTFSAFKFTSTFTRTVNGVTRTETATRWRDASGSDSRTLKLSSVFTYTSGTPAQGALVSTNRELQSYQ